MERVDIILKKYISEKIPKYATNIFWQMFNGINAIFSTLEYRLDITKRERNMLTAQHISSLRNIASENGFQPKLKIPANGLLKLTINPKLFSRVGYPLFLPPYSVFTDKLTKLKYYYNSNKTLRLQNNTILIPVIEGEIKSISTIKTSSNYIERVYLSEENIAQNSIIVECNGIEFSEVESFFDNENLNNNKQWLFKFSNNIQKPIIIYIKGLQLNDSIVITYKLTSGEIGNIDYQHEFETENIIDNNANNINVADDEINILNFDGFDFGSNGTDENSLRAAIGYNHGKTLLFDNISYTNFLGKYSTLLIQKITNDPIEKSINNLYLGKKQSLNISSANSQDYISQYQSIINAQGYFLKKQEKINLSKIIDEFEYALTSHVINDINTCKFAFQFIFDTNDEKTTYSEKLQELVYIEFSKFFYIKNHIINMENLFESFMVENNIKFEYIIFNQLIEAEKLTKKVETVTPYIIKHDNYLPILKGDFVICDSTFNSVKLFFDINMVTK